jgi:glutamine amidotransferase
VIVIDYGVGNLGSILNMLKKVGVPAKLSRGPEDVLLADKIILPGVGAFDSAMKKLREFDYVDALAQRVLVDKVPILGICLGMQMFGRQSEEGQEPGLGWLNANTERFRFNDTTQTQKIPHMGWNRIKIRGSVPFFPDQDEDQRFYFVHSYHLQCNDSADVMATAWYGLDFVCAVFHKNIVGTQFHPEKSHRFGMEFFRRFAEWTPC